MSGARGAARGRCSRSPTGARTAPSAPTGDVRGCYVHGLFGHDAQRRAWLDWIGAPASALAYEAEVEATLDGLAEHLDRHVASRRCCALARRRSTLTFRLPYKPRATRRVFRRFFFAASPPRQEFGP